MAELTPTEKRKRLKLLSKGTAWRDETAYRRHVTAFAELLGLAVNFTYRAKTPDGSWRTNATSVGFPDLTICGRGRLIVLELKMPGKRPSDAQVAWIARLQAVPGVDAFVVWPADWHDVRDLLLEAAEPDVADELEADELFG